MACKKFIGVLKYNSVFVTDDSLSRLQEQGFGAKLFKPLPKPHGDHERASVVATPVQNVECSNNSAEIDATDTSVPSTNAGQFNNGIELSTGDTTDSDLIDALAILTGKSEQDVDKNVDNMFEGNIVEEIIDEKATSLALMLLDEEAFFLYTHDYLQLVTLNGSPVTSSLQLWHKFCEKNSKFPIKYKVYTFFRDRGYVVKTAGNSLTHSLSHSLTHSLSAFRFRLRGVSHDSCHESLRNMRPGGGCDEAIRHNVIVQGNGGVVVSTGLATHIYSDSGDA